MIIENNPLQQDDSSKVKYTIFFKISEIANAKAVHISLGTEQDVGDVLQIEAMYKLQNGNYFLNYNSKSYAYSNYTSYLEITLLKQNLSNMKYLTLYIDDNDGNVTQKYYCNVKP